MGRLRFALALVCAAAASLGGSWVGAQVHHVVGGDRGWDPDSGVGAWFSGRVFSVGDKLWFTYSAAKESVAEVRTRQEYESCDISNPIRMYTDGINSLSLDQEGSRYFASSKAESCKNGLKLHVDVKPRSPWEITVATSEGSPIASAEGPLSSSNVQPRSPWKIKVATSEGSAIALAESPLSPSNVQPPWEITVATSEGSAIALAEDPLSSSNVRLRISWIGAGVLAVVTLIGF